MHSRRRSLADDPRTADGVARHHQPHATAEVVAPEPPPRRRGLSPVFWVVGLIAVVAVLLLAFGVGL